MINELESPYVKSMDEVLYTVQSDNILAVERNNRVFIKPTPSEDRQFNGDKINFYHFDELGRR